MKKMYRCASLYYIIACCFWIPRSFGRGFELFCPLEETVPTVTDKMIKVHPPAFTNKWVTLAGEERATQSVMLLVDVSTEVHDGAHVLLDLASQPQSQLTMNISDSFLFNAEKYLNPFTITEEGREQPRCTKESLKK